MTIKIQQNADFSKQMEKCHDEMPCIVCGRPCPNAQWMIHLVDGGEAALPDEEVEESADMYYYPIGTNCLKKHPELKPYAVKQQDIK